MMNERQRRFADGVLQGKSVVQAYKDAGYSPKTAERNAWRMKENEGVQAYLAEQREKVEERTLLSAERVVDELGRQAFWDPLELIQAGVETLEDLKDAPKEIRCLIEGWKWDSEGRLVLEFVSRQKALDRLGKVFGVFQGDWENDTDREAMLATQLLWRFVFALHVSKGLTIGAALTWAQNNPDEVEAWGREKGIPVDGSVGGY